MRKYTKREKERGLGPLVASSPRGGALALGKAKGVADLGDRGEGEWKRVVMVFVVGHNGGVDF